MNRHNRKTRNRRFAAPDRSRRSAQRGFTIIEAILAIIVLAVAIPPMLWSMREAHVQRVNPMLASRAHWLAVEKLEDIIADRHSMTRGYDYVINSNYPDETDMPGAPGFARSVEIAETAADLATVGDGYKTVTVRVTWTDATGSSRELQMPTVVTDY